jgi:hypothetical protein
MRGRARKKCIGFHRPCPAADRPDEFGESLFPAVPAPSSGDEEDQVFAVSLADDDFVDGFDDGVFGDVLMLAHAPR